MTSMAASRIRWYFSGSLPEGCAGEAKGSDLATVFSGITRATESSMYWDAVREATPK
jgi:hypothetical protein